MKKIFPFIVLLIITITSLFYFHSERDNRRMQYEKYILNTALKIQNEGEKSGNGTGADDPSAAAMQEFFKTVDPRVGYVPVERLIDAYKQTVELEQKQKTDRNNPPVIYWNQLGSNMGGRTRMIMFDPNDPGHKKVWAGGVTGGLWYNNDITDATSSWVPVGDFWSNLAISCMAYDPNNSQVMYIGTGEAQTARIIYRKSSGVGCGIFKTEDGGETWNLLTTTGGFKYITDIVVKNENGNSVIYAGVVSGTYEGQNHQSEPSDGLYRSDDNGNTWTQVLPDIPGTPGIPYAVADIELAANGRIFVGTMENLNLKGGATILYSDNGLSGSWTVYDHYNNVISNDNDWTIPARTIIASAPSNPDIVYAQFAGGRNDEFIYYRGRYMAKSNDGGATWTNVNIPAPDWSTLAWHAFDLAISPNNPDILFTGGLDLWRTNNGGNYWRKVSDWSLMYSGGGDDYVHADQHHIIYRPNHPETAVFSSDGGVFLTNTANQTQPVFMERNKGFATLQFYTCCINPTAGSHQYIGGLQDNGTLEYSGTPFDLFDMIDGGDGAFCFWDQDEPSVFITSVYYNQYKSYLNGNVTGWFGGNSGTFISPADYDYKNNILYSNAVKFSGYNSNTLLRAKNIPLNPSSQLININTGVTVPFSAVTYSPYSQPGTSTLFVGTVSGRLFKVVNAQNNPSSTEIGSPDFPDGNISCIALGNSEDTLLVTFSNYGVSSVWQSYDGGNSWQEKEANLPDMPIRWAIYHPENTGQALLATELGVWATNTLKVEETEWAPAVDGMANVRVDMLKIRKSDNHVLAATHGRGFFTTTYVKDIYDDIKEPVSDNGNLKIFPNPAKSHINISTGNSNTAKAVITFVSQTGMEVLKKEVKLTNGNFQGFDVSYLPKGIYIVNVSTEDYRTTKKVIIE